MEILYDYYKDGKKKAITLSYDDGTIFDRRMVEIMNRYGIRGTFNLCSGKFGQQNYLESGEVKELFQGHEVAVHTVTHPDLALNPDWKIIDEITQDKAYLENLVGYLVRGLAYPFGTYNEKLVNLLPNLGIEYARAGNSHGNFLIPNNFLTWNPTCKHRENLLDKHDEFKNLLSCIKLPLFYICGHSFEFNNNNNWELLEEFCKRAGGDDDVWYATNIEIYDYIQALRSLKWSGDRKKVLNMSTIPVWIGVDDEAVKIDAGKLLEL